MSDRLCEDDLETLPLPKGWAANVRNTVLNVLGLARIALLTGRQFLAEEGDVLTARIYHLEAEAEMLREELRIIGARMETIDEH